MNKFQLTTQVNTHSKENLHWLKKIVFLLCISLTLMSIISYLIFTEILLSSFQSHHNHIEPKIDLDGIQQNFEYTFSSINHPFFKEIEIVRSQPSEFKGEFEDKLRMVFLSWKSILKQNSRSIMETHIVAILEPIAQIITTLEEKNLLEVSAVFKEIFLIFEQIIQLQEENWMGNDIHRQLAIADFDWTFKSLYRLITS
jgi:hypothetical protein